MLYAENKKIIKYTAGVAIALVVMASSLYTVNAGERAVITRFGKVNAISGDGLHLKLPFVDSVEKISVRTRKATSPANAGTNDLQNVTTEVTLNYHLDPLKLEDTYTRVGLDVEHKVIDPRIQEVVKGVLAKYTAEQLLKQREAVKGAIVNGLRSSIAEYNIILEDVQITNFSFSKTFDDAIEAKQTAEQNALKAKNDLDRIKVEAEQKIAMAQAEAETIRIQAAAIREQGGQAYVQLKAIEKWDGALPKMAGASVPFINVDKL